MIDDHDTRLFGVLDSIHESSQTPDVNRIHELAEAHRSSQRVNLWVLGTAVVIFGVIGLLASQADGRSDSLVTADDQFEVEQADSSETVVQANEDERGVELSELLTWIGDHDDPTRTRLTSYVRVVAVDNDEEVNGVMLDLLAIPQSDGATALEVFVSANCGSLVSRGLFTPSDGAWQYLAGGRAKEASAGVLGDLPNCDAFEPPSRIQSLLSTTFDIELETNTLEIDDGIEVISFVVTVPDQGALGFPGATQSTSGLVSLQDAGYAIPDDASESALEIFSDGYVTFAEYRRAAFAAGVCIEDLGLEVEYEIFDPRVGYDITVTTGNITSNDRFPSDEIDACYAALFDDVSNAWFDVNSIDEDDLEAFSLWQAECATGALSQGGETLSDDTQQNVIQASSLTPSEFWPCVSRFLAGER